VQVPTTLLAQIDAAVGGKTGVDLPEGKNLIGAFHQPVGVVADVGTLETLPEREYRSGLGEVAKYALIARMTGDHTALADLVAAQAAAIRARDLEILTDLVSRCVELKADVVMRDPEERTGLRSILNYGHTLAHALETSTGYDDLLHGEAVALGLIAAAEISVKLGLAPAALPGRVATALGRCGLDTDLGRWRRTRVLAHIAVDKKRHGSRVRFVALEDVGRVRLHEIEIAELGGLLGAL
jgi:3-dehydroquinate synthetase